MRQVVAGGDLDALTALVAETRAEPSGREIAARADVSVRTVYRYFPDRTALLEGLADWYGEQMTGPDESGLRDLGDAAAIVDSVYADLEALEPLTSTSIVLRRLTGIETSDHRGRTELFERLTAASAPQLPDDDRYAAAAIARILASGDMWLRLRDEFGLDAERSGRAVGWALGALARDLAVRERLEAPVAAPADD